MSDDTLGTKTIYATIEEPATSRVQLNEQKQTVWTAGDEVCVYGPLQYPYLYRFTGETGDRGGTFVSLGYYPDDAFQGALFDRYYAVTHAAGGSYYGFYTLDSMPVIFLESQAVQTYLPSSYGVCSNAMVGTSLDGENFTFQNLFGYLRFSLIGGQKVSKIELTGKNNEPLAGLHYFVIDQPTKLYWNDVSATTLTLDCGEGVQLTSTPTDFYFALPPTDFTQGFSAMVYFEDGTTYPLETNKAVSITRNTIQPMAKRDLGGGFEWQRVTITHSGSTFFAPRLAHPTATPSGFIYWGDGAQARINALTRYDYTDELPSHTISIEASDVDILLFNSCKGVSKIDLSNF